MATGHDIYFYKMTDDSGFAPCVEGGKLTLATCKPDIRRMAVPGDVIIGFSCNDDGARLIYAARVTKRLSNGDYYRSSAYRGRLDCIYEDDGGKARHRKGVEVHIGREHLLRDVGDRFENAYVLLSTDFRYFGADGPNDAAPPHPHLRRAVLACARGHRVNHESAVRNELDRLLVWLWEESGSGGHSEPTRPLHKGGCACGRRPRPTRRRN
jgi:hypothetical protein